MSIVHAIVLGVVQGLSEFLPISSSGHLLLVPWLFGWNDFAGHAHLEKTFDVALHLGTFVGAVVYFRSDLWRMLRAVLSRDAADEPERRLAWLLVLGSLPAALVGAAFQSTIEEHLGQIWLIALMLIVFGVVLAWADRIRGDREIEGLRVRDALLVGVAQACALQPGVSRSGVTITAARGLRFERDSAARLSFLLSLPIIGGAVAKSGLDLVTDGFPEGFAAPFFWGIVASGITGYIAVWGTLRIVRTRSFTPFVVYRILAGASVLVLLATNFR